MNSTLSITTPPFCNKSPITPNLHRPCNTLLLSSHTTTTTLKRKTLIIVNAASKNDNPSSTKPSISPLKTAACAAVILAAAAFGKFPQFPAIAEVSPPQQTLSENLPSYEEQEQEKIQNSSLTELLESNPEAIEALKKLLLEKLECGEDEESLSILRKLLASQPDNLEWKFLIARVLNELGRVQEARDAFEEVLAKNPLSFEALFENSLLMDRSGEGEGVMRRLEEALRVAEGENKVKEARNVKLITAQMQFLHKEVDEALRSYDELVREDPLDFRPYFCKGMIYSLMDRNVEATEQFAKYRELSPKKFEVKGYLRTPLSRMKLFGTDEEN